MITLTPQEAKTYEGIKAGLNSAQIAEQNKSGGSAIRCHIRFLEKEGMVKRSGVIKRKYSYEAVDKPYNVETRSPELRKKVQMDYKADVFLTKAMNVEVTDDIAFYLKNNKHLKRSVLRKKTGMSRLELNFALERMQA